MPTPPPERRLPGPSSTPAEAGPPVEHLLPERIDGGSFVLRRSRVDDAATLAAAVRENQERLAAWLPWAAESGNSGNVAFQRRRLAAADEEWNAGQDFNYLAVDGETDRFLGGLALHRRMGPGGLEIGYWLAAEATGRGVATAAAGLLTRAALAVPDVDRVEIHCDVGNVRSQAIPRRLGFRLDRIVDSDTRAPATTGRTMIWVFPPS